MSIFVKQFYVAMKKGDQVIGPTSSSISETTCNLPSIFNQTTTNEFSPNYNTTNHALHAYGQFRTGNEEDMAYLNNQKEVNANNGLLLASSTTTWSHDNNQLHNYMDFGVNLADNNGNNNSDFSGNVNGDGMKVGDEIFDDCYGDLGTLPEVNYYYNYYYGISGSLFDGVYSD